MIRKDLTVILLFVFYISCNFFGLSVLCLFIYFFVVKCFNSFLISFDVYSITIFFVVTMGITFKILKLKHCSLNVSQFNFNHIQKLCLLQLHPLPSQSWMSQNDIFVLCPKTQNNNCFFLMHQFLKLCRKQNAQLETKVTIILAFRQII